MHTVLNEVLTVNDVARVSELVGSETLIDGRATLIVGGKRNLQLPVDSDTARQAGAIVVARLLANEQFNLFAQPAVVHPPLFSRYEDGMEYPDHIDVALMGRVRTDLAVTVFLSAPDTYAGGELVVDTGNGIRSFRLAAGDAVVYPASTVHHVACVTHGVRLVAALWVQSLMRDPAQREILYDLARTMGACNDTVCGGRLRRSYWNLVRMWAETPHGS